MKLRKAELKDKEDVLEITKLLHLDIPDFVWDTGEFVEKQIKRGEYFLVEKEGKVVGIISLRQRQNKMHIETIAVKNGSQAEGIGTKLIDFAKEHTKQKGLNVLRAYSFYEYKSVDFYLKRGFNLLSKPGRYKNHKYYRFEMEID
ncbi:MAG: GNAT family N-acetyltransferase [Candidatus Nealsonbacteria bacterium]|nr:GNAT family N-acetyltransferase [Candidatus Nealsonbacteria bacterium]